MKDQVKADPALLDIMLKVYDHAPYINKGIVNRFAIGAFNDLKNGRQQSNPPIFQEDHYIGSWNARFDNLEKIDGGNTDVKNKKSGIVHSLKSPHNLQGDFAIAAYHQKKDQLILIRDHLGTRPLYYIETSEYFAFATEMKPLKSLPGYIHEMDEVWIADAISILQSEKWRTPYKGIKRLLPGHYLIFNEKTEIAEYWDLNVQTQYTGIDYQEAVELFKIKFKQAVCKRLGNGENNSAELSGGLDSSGVTAKAMECLNENRSQLYALTHAFSEQSLGQFFPFSDEREFSNEVCNYIGLSNHVLCDADNQGLIEEMRKDIFTQSGPTQQSYSLFSDALYERARDLDVSILLSGFGGDEGVTSKAGGFFEELAIRGDWDLYKHEYFERLKVQHNDHLLNRSKYYLKKYFPSVEILAKRYFNGSDWLKEKYPYFAFSDEFEERMNIKERFFTRLRLPDDPNVRERQYKKIKHAHISQRFEYSYLNAKAYGIEYAYPLWDINLLEFYYSLPAEFKFRKGMGRAIYRDTLKGLLPEKVRLRNDKSGATIPTVHQRFLKDYDRITDLIKNVGAKNRYHYLNPLKMLEWQKRLKENKARSGAPPIPSGFFNSLKILLLQEMERKGEFKSGIRT